LKTRKVTPVWQRASIVNSPTTGAVGELILMTLLDFEFVIHVAAKCVYCLDVTPWGPCINIDHTECNDPVTFTGSIYAVTSADIIHPSAEPWNVTTTTHIVAPIRSSGCSRDWIPFDTNIQDALNEAVVIILIASINSLH